MMPFVTDRQRVEQLLFIDQLRHVITIGARDVQEPETAETLRLLTQSRLETVALCRAQTFRKAQSRLERLDTAVFAPRRNEGAELADEGLALYCLLRRLIDTGYLAIVEGSAFDHATGPILRALQSRADEPGAMDEAETSAREIEADLRTQGYFLGLPEREA
ncbi:hypothetical protein [Aureimonas sp. AU40]|uniref:hypothetical protein n=1 Tax=Aureimonas sp. AU40 TaxID=1637747 RepID=UPI0007837C19|nr:hypothetical protein [Aureimonas sp. AU40]